MSEWAPGEEAGNCKAPRPPRRAAINRVSASVPRWAAEDGRLLARLWIASRPAIRPERGTAAAAPDAPLGRAARTAIHRTPASVARESALVAEICASRRHALASTAALIRHPSSAARLWRRAQPTTRKDGTAAIPSDSAADVLVRAALRNAWPHPTVQHGRMPTDAESTAATEVRSLACAAVEKIAASITVYAAVEAGLLTRASRTRRRARAVRGDRDDAAAPAETPAAAKFVTYAGAAADRSAASVRIDTARVAKF
jgi:hypothetical protein